MYNYHRAQTSEVSHSVPRTARFPLASQIPATDIPVACGASPAVPCPAGYYPDETILDHTALLARLEGDLGLLRELMSLFVAQYPVHLARARRAILHQDIAALAREALTLQGMLGNLGAREAMVALQHLACVSRTTPWCSAAEAYFACEDAITRFASTLRAFYRAARVSSLIHNLTAPRLPAPDEEPHTETSDTRPVGPTTDLSQKPRRRTTPCQSAKKPGFVGTSPKVPRRMQTTLYDLIATLQTCTQPDEDAVVVATVEQLLASRRLRFSGGQQTLDA